MVPPVGSTNLQGWFNPVPSLLATPPSHQVHGSYMGFHRPTRARICKPFKGPRNRFPAWRASMTTLFVVPARQATEAGEIDSSESIPGLHKHLQIRALVGFTQFLFSQQFPRYMVPIRCSTHRFFKRLFSFLMFRPQNNFHHFSYIAKIIFSES